MLRDFKLPLVAIFLALLLPFYTRGARLQIRGCTVVGKSHFCVFANKDVHVLTKWRSRGGMSTLKLFMHGHIHC